MRKSLLIALGVLIGAGLLGAVWVSSRTTPVSPRTVIGTFGGVSLKIELATSTADWELGLGGRAVLPEDEAMLFVFPVDDRYGFWMKDTLIPLDMFWLDDKGQVVFAALNVQPDSYPNVLYPSVRARYVLETNAGFGRVHQVATGTPLLLKNGLPVSN